MDALRTGPRVRAPELRAGRWFGTDPLSLDALRGRFVLLDFWTSACANCLHIVPELHRLEQQSRRDRERRRKAGAGVGIPPWVAVLAVLVIVGGVLYIVGKNNGRTPSNSASHTTTTTHHTRARRHHARPHHAVTKRPAGPRMVTVSLTATSPTATFICLENAQGRQLVNGNFVSGDTIPSATAPKLLLTVESPTVTIKANGKTIANTSTGSPVTYRITPHAHVVLTTTDPNETCGL